MTTTTVYADAADGQIGSSESSEFSGTPYLDARAGTNLALNGDGSSLFSVGQRISAEDFDVFYVYEGFISFDTSSIDDGDTVSAAVLNVTSSADYSTTDFTIQARLHDWGATLTTADWVAGASLSGLTLLATYATSSGFTTNSAYDFTDSAMPANTSKTGVTRMLLCSNETVAATEQYSDSYVSIKSADTTGTTSDPKLTVTHAAGSSSQGITLGLLDASPALYAPVVDAEGNHELYAPTLTPKNTITLALLDAVAELYAPTVTQTGGPQTVTLELLDGGAALYAPVLTPKNTVFLGLLDSSPALYAPSLAVGPVSVTLTLLDGGPAVYAPTVTQASGPQTIALAQLDAGPAVYAPTLVGKNTITLGLLDASSALYAPSLAVGPVTVTLTLLDGGPALYAPTVTQGSGVQAISLGLLDASSALYAPTLVGKSSVSLSLLDAGPALYAPTVGRTNTLVVPLLDASGALYAPTVVAGAVSVTLTLLDGSRAVYAPSLSPKNSLVIPLLDASGALYAPALILGTGVFSGGRGPTATAASPVPSATSASPVPSGRSSSPTPR